VQHVPPWDTPLERSHLVSAHYLLLNHFAGSRGNVCSSLVPEGRLSHTNPECRCSDSRREAVKRVWSREARRGRGKQTKVKQACKKKSRERMASRSTFYKPRAKGGVTTRSPAPNSRTAPLPPHPVTLIPCRPSLPCSGDWTRVVPVPPPGHPRRDMTGADNALGLSP